MSSLITSLKVSSVFPSTSIDFPFQHFVLDWRTKYFFRNVNCEEFPEREENIFNQLKKEVKALLSCWKESGNCCAKNKIIGKLLEKHFGIKAKKLVWCFHELNTIIDLLTLNDWNGVKQLIALKKREVCLKYLLYYFKWTLKYE